jgi:hypothetical protein
MEYGLMRDGSRVILGLIVLCIAGLALRCSDDKTCCAPKHGPGCEPVAENLLDCLCHAYGEQDVDSYGNLLHEQFRFEFVPHIAESLGLPAEEPWWGKASEVLVTENIFSDPSVTQVEMDLGEPTVWYAEVDTVTGLECLKARFMPDIRIRLQEAGEVEERTLVVGHSWFDIRVVPDPDHPGWWCVLAITESVLPDVGSRLGMDTGYTTWSDIKYYFRPRPVKWVGKDEIASLRSQ